MNQYQKPTETVLQNITELQERLNAIREVYGIHDQDEVIFREEIDCTPGSDDRIEVLADGLGGATLQRVEGTWDNTMCYHSRDFETEPEAVQVAEWMVEHLGRMHEVWEGQSPWKEELEEETNETS